MKKLALLFPVLCFAFSILLHAESYAKQNWQPTVLDLPKSLPTIREGLSLYKLRTPIRVDDRIVWVYEAPSLRFGLFIWDPEQGTTQYPLELSERIRSIAYDSKTRTLLLRTARAIHFYSASDFSLQKKVAFENLPAHWNLMTAQDGILYMLRVQDRELPPVVESYSLPVLHKIGSFDAPKSKVQCMLALPGKELLLWSSYWGNETLTVDAANGTVLRTERVLSYHMHAMFSAIVRSDGDLMVYDQESQKIGLLRRVNQLWVDLARSELLEGGFAYRFNPVSDGLLGSFSITATADRPASRIALVIPPLSTYAQEITDEEILQPGELVSDELGNRHLLLSIPMLKRGQTHSTLFYRSRLRRFSTVYDLSALPSDLPTALPTIMKGQYLGDSERYQLSHPLVAGFYDTLFASQPNLAALVQSIYRFTVERIDGKWDGETENVPEILMNLHGGCTEHSYAAIAFLRKAGLPSRFNWNYYGRKEDRDLSFNHKFTEVYIHPIGWLPMEPLGGLRSSAGEVASYPLIFSVRADLGNRFIQRRDRLGAYLDNPEPSWNSAPIKIAWTLE